MIALLFTMIVVCAVFALIIFVWGTIFKKAGYSFWMSLLMLVPIANLVWVLVFAFSTWPIQRELEAYRSGGGTGRGFPAAPPPAI